MNKSRVPTPLSKYSSIYCHRALLLCSAPIIEDILSAITGLIITEDYLTDYITGSQIGGCDLQRTNPLVKYHKFVVHMETGTRTLSIILGCNGAPLKDYPEDAARCCFCYAATAGEISIIVPQEVYVQALINEMSIEELIESGYLSGQPSPCETTGAVRYYTSSILG